MFDINKKDTIYYGTSIEYIEEMDRIGVLGSRHRDEQYISVSISGYESSHELVHDDLIEFGRIYSEVLEIADVIENRLVYKIGYENSMTYVEGFGPNPSKYLRGFFGLVDNRRTINTVTAVICPEAITQLVVPNENRKFEYLSQALHGFMNRIRSDDIIAWIVPDSHYKRINDMISAGELKKRNVISDKQIKSQKFDSKILSMYGSYPSNIEFYCKGLTQNKYFRDTRIKHLKYILEDFVEIDWDVDDKVLEQKLISWSRDNSSKIIWDYEDLKYKCVGNKTIIG